MNRDLHVVLRDQRRQNRKQMLRFLLIVGGGKEGLLRHAHVWKPDAILRLDVPQELSQGTRPLRGNAFYQEFALAVSQTSDSLFEDAPPEQRALIRGLGSMNAANGLGQIRGAGGQATRQLVMTAEFEDYLRRLVDEFVIRAHGIPLGVDARGVSSEAGGTGSEGVIIAMDRIVRALASLGIPIDAQFDALGAVTFTGHGRRLGPNSVAATMDFVHNQLTKRGGQELQIARSLSLVELPPVRHDSALRNHYVALDEQALAGEELQSHLLRTRPNNSFGGALGNITLRQVEFFEGLDPATEVAPQVAEVYFLECNAAMLAATPCASLVQTVDVQSSTVSLSREAVEPLLERAQHLSDADLRHELKAPAARWSYRISLRTTQGQEFLLSRIRSYFTTVPESLREAQLRLQLQRSLLQALNEEITRLDANVQQIKEEIEDCELTVGQMQSGKGVWLRFRTQHARQRLLLSAATNLRAASDEYHEQRELLRELTVATNELQHEERHLTTRLGLLRDTLLGHCHRGEQVQPLSYVYVRPLDEAFREVIDLAQLSLEHQREILCAQVNAVTDAGLAHAVRADWPRVESIAARIVNGTAPVEGPPLGGKATTSDSQIVYVLPPMLPESSEPLRRAIQKLTDGALVVCADDASAGINVVRYRFRQVGSLPELFPGRLRRQLAEMLTDPLVELYGVTEKARELGITVENGEVVFATQDKE